MKRYIASRILFFIPVIFLVSVFSFALVFLAPGDPASSYRTSDMTEEEYQQVKTELGYNDPIIVQYGRWLGRVLQGDFGISTSSKTKVLPLILQKLPATIGLMGASILFSLAVSVPLGMLAGCREGSVFDRIVSVLNYVGISIPSFWFGIMLIVLLSLQLHLLPSSGMRTTGVTSLLDLAAHAAMPVIVLSIGKISIYTRYVRSETLKQMSEDYVLSAIAKGAGRGYILRRHVLKNCLLPIITLVGMNMGSLVSGAYIVETLFGWPGLGTTGMSAIYSRDYNMIMGTTMLSCVILILGNFAADLLYTVADPRIKAFGGRRA
ncbi:peptide ABC transporter permease [Oscillospiraceae bacterium]|nr:peptide ABC transporter permease [Oscillospiraceae bacterium]BDF76761.1 peptide ABC transporter permease [Oscillospiraceae bacterium]